NNGVVVRGTVADRNLDYYQLEYADDAMPDTWHPIGPASSIPVFDDVMAAWVPEKPGTYVLRLRAYDRAGNARIQAKVISWDRVPVLANVTQDEVLISPNGNGPKKTVTFRWLVRDPARVDLRILGPDPRRETSTAPTVLQLSREYPVPRTDAFTW